MEEEEVEEEEEEEEVEEEVVAAVREAEEGDMVGLEVQVVILPETLWHGLTEDYFLWE